MQCCRSVVPVALLLAQVLFFIGCSGNAADDQQNQNAPLPQVNVVEVMREDVPVYQEFVGQIEAQKTVDVRARVEGFLLERLFDEGMLVKQGDLLFVIDPKPFQEKLKQAKAQLERDEAALAKGQKDYVRFKRLYEEGAVSGDEYDTKETRLRELRADVDKSKSVVEDARIDLGYTKIYAPISGIIGRTQVNIGSLVGKGEPTLLARISIVDPIYVNFSIPERMYLLAVKDMEDHKKRNGDADPAPLRIKLSDDTIYPCNGTFNMVDRAVNAETGTLGIRALFPNKDGLLRDGQFAKVIAKIQMFNDALIVPTRAIKDLQGRKSVLVVDSAGMIVDTPVKVGTDWHNVSVITEGLKEGDKIIADGVRKFRAGMKVTPKVVPMEIPGLQPANATRGAPGYQPDCGVPQNATDGFPTHTESAS